jgi:LacI family transcriptional regulator
VVDDPDCIRIEINNVQAAYEATRHLLEQGCRRIMHVGGNLSSSVYRGRHEGYRKALVDFGIPYDPDLLIFPDLRDSSGAAVIEAVLAMNPRPDGIFTVNDTLAIGSLFGLKRAGISVPKEIAIVGFNDNPLARVIDPMLSTVYYPGYRMGEIAAQTLIDLFNHHAPPAENPIILPHQLIIRESSLKRKKQSCPDEMAGQL